MSTNESNTQPEYDPNIKIKAEPGTISEPSTSVSSATPNLITNIKTEPGLSASTGATTRLPSFRVPRDLTLGGNIKLERPKKVYTPNLNAQRFKNREDPSTATKNEPALKSNRGRGRGKNDRGKERGRGRGKAGSNLVQSSGVFSEGLADISTRRHGGGGFRDRDSSRSERDTASLGRTKLSIPQKIDKVEEAEKIRELLRDDFTDDVDIDLENTPVVLPMIEEGKLFKTIPKDISSFKETSDKSVALQNGEAKVKGKIKSVSPQVKLKETKLPLTVPQVIENKTNNFILMQLPDCLPGLQTDDKHDPKSKRTTEQSVENEAAKLNKFCTLNDLKEGMLGKLQILRSGKARLVLGDNDLIIDVGSNLSFRQDLIAAKIAGDKQSGDLVNLGPVNNTLICSPNWENMLKKL